MKIIDYMKCWFGIDNNTAATIFITILIFVIGILLNESRKLITRQLRANSVRKLFSDSIKHLARTARLQSKEFLSLKQQLEIDSVRVFDLKMTTLTYLKIIDNLPFTDLYNSCFYHWFSGTKFREKSFHTVLSSVRLLLEEDVRYKEDFQLFIEKFNQFENEWNKNVNGLRTLFDEVINSTRDQPVPAALGLYIQDFDRIWAAWQLQENRIQFLVLKEHLLDPLRAMNRDHANINLIPVTTNYILGALHAFENLSAWLNLNADKYETYSFNYRKAARKLDICSKSLRW